jgi:hypothetical protein
LEKKMEDRIWTIDTKLVDFSRFSSVFHLSSQMRTLVHIWAELKACKSKGCSMTRF